MGALDAVSLGILLASLLILAGILSSLVALRFGAPLLLVFLLVGMLAGEAGPLGIQFDDVRLAYTIGSVALALILFDGGLRTRYQTFRNVIGPAGLLATVGVLVTAAVTAPVAVFALGLGWTEALLVGAVVASTDAAAVFFLLHAKGLRLRPARQRDARGRIRHQRSVRDLPHHRADRDHSARRQAMAPRSRLFLITETLSAAWSAISAAAPWCWCSTGSTCRRACMRRSWRPARSWCSRLAEVAHGSGFLAVYVAGLVVGNSAVRAHNAVVTFLDAATWLAQIGMFVVLGLLAWPDRLPQTILPALGGCARADADRAAGGRVPVPCALSVQLAREGIHVLGRPARRGRHLHRLDSACWWACRMRNSISTSGFVVVLVSLLVQGWTIAPSARWLQGLVPAQRSAAAPGRARSAGPARAGDRRLSAQRQQPLSAARLVADLGAADAGGARRAHPESGGG